MIKLHCTQKKKLDTLTRMAVIPGKLREGGKMNPIPRCDWLPEGYCPLQTSAQKFSFAKYFLWFLSRNRTRKRENRNVLSPSYRLASFSVLESMKIISQCSLCHIINPLLTTLVWSRWLDSGFVLFLRFYFSYSLYLFWFSDLRLWGLSKGSFYQPMLFFSRQVLFSILGCISINELR